MNNSKPTAGQLLAVLLMFIAPLANALDADDVLSPQYQQSNLPLNDGDQIKFAECKSNGNSQSCSYVWGTPSDKDAARVEYGLAPDGDNLMIILAKGRSSKDFERSIASYSDAVAVENLAAEAVWSERRNQLSLMQDNFVIIHVNVSSIDVNDRRALAEEIADQLMAIEFQLD